MWWGGLVSICDSDLFIIEHCKLHVPFPPTPMDRKSGSYDDCGEHTPVSHQDIEFYHKGSYDLHLALSCFGRFFYPIQIGFIWLSLQGSVIRGDALTLTLVGSCVPEVRCRYIRQHRWSKCLLCRTYTRSSPEGGVVKVT